MSSEEDNKSLEKQINEKFHVYYKLDYARVQTEQDPQKRVFTFEPEIQTHGASHGSRRYFAACLPDFWDWYTKECTAPRYVYELIKEDAPCRCFFDLEYYKQYNPDVDEEKILDDFIRTVCDFFKKYLNVKLDPDKNFLLLDSTTDTKFSFHVIVHMPNGKLFLPPSPQSLREPIIKKLCEWCKERQICLVNSDKGLKCLHDTVIYTHNRDFRLLLSTKRQKKAALKYADSCKFYDKKPADHDYQLFLDSLITPVDYEKHPVFTKQELDRILNMDKVAKKRTATVQSNVAQANKKKKGPRFVLK